MTHLESLIAEFYDWKGYLVKVNTKVGRLAHGGWEMELDVIAFDPHTEHLIHLEPSVDAHSWAIRESRYLKKFESGRRYIFSEVFTWLPETTPIEQVAIFPNHPKGRDSIAGGSILSIDEMMGRIRNEIIECGRMVKNAIPEQYSMLRTIQLSHCGYNRAIQ